MIKIIWAGSTSACFELENENPYLAPSPYTVLLDGEERLRGETNVFSLYGLSPDTAYTLTLRSEAGEESLPFRTGGETCALDVKTLGAAGDGVTDDTAAIQRAVLVLPEGGRLFFPAGVYLTGPIFLKSHITLELAEGATLLGFAGKEHYPVLPGVLPDLDGGADVHVGAFEGLARASYASLLTGEYCEDVTLVGPGLVDGNAPNGTWWQTYREDPIARPRLLFLNRCRNVTVHGLRIANSPSWQLHPYYSDHVRFYGVSVTAPKISPNTDALDPESCDDVEIIGCRFSVGDDCIAIKSGKLELARTNYKPASRHTIRNCLMENGHGAVVLGSEISSGVEELSVSQCLFRQTDRGLRIKTRRGRGETCRIDGVSFENIRMEGVLTPIVINMYYRCVDPDGDSEYVQTREPLPVDGRTPFLGRFAFRRMTCDDVEVAACYIDGLPERPVEEVVLEDIRFTYKPDAQPGVPAMFTNAPAHCKLGMYCNNVRRVTARNVTLEGVDGEELLASGVEQIER